MKIKIIDDGADGTQDGKVITLNKESQKILTGATITCYSKPMDREADFVPAVNLYFYQPTNDSKKTGFKNVITVSEAFESLKTINNSHGEGE